MSPLFKKLNWKDHSPILIRHAPDSFQNELKQIAALTEVHTGLQEGLTYSFVLLFAEKVTDLHLRIDAIKHVWEGDVVLWFAYPKKSSQKYVSDITRDSGWLPLGELGFEGVRQVAIDADWSALRFRHVDYIKTMKWDNGCAMSEKGKKRTQK
ncbi:MAG: hypothetical protein AAF655_06570 [Bacteroidota bacterium]